MTETALPEAWLTDTQPSSRYPLYTRLNANDVLPDPITPMGATLAWIPHILPGWAAGYVALDAFTPTELGGEDLSPTGGFFYGRLYNNQTLVRLMGIRAGLGWQAIDAAFFGPGAPVHEDRPEDVNETLSARMAERTNWTLTTTTYPDLEEERRIADGCRADRPDLASLSAAALVARARSLMPLERLVWRGEVIGSSQSAVGPSVVAQLVAPHDPSLVAKLLGNAGDVDSAAPSFALWDLSRMVRDDAGVTATFDAATFGAATTGAATVSAGATGLLGRLREEHPDFATRFDGFLREYGYRGPSEWDVGSDSWETHPELPLALIDRLRHLPDESSPTHRRAAQDGDTESAFKQANDLLEDPESQRMLAQAVASARRFGAWRERGKTNCIKVLHEARVALFELGRRLHAAGQLSSPRQIFLALESELDILVADPGAVKTTLDDREQQWLGLFDVEVPTYVTAGTPLLPLPDLPRRDAARFDAVKPGDVLTGGPASAGVGRGRARVVRNTAEIADFQPGEILVAPQTDPSWTPLFMVAAGVVVDVGALGSHAMIVSRELGIPCAAGVTGATGRIPTGALLEVDGSTGTVTVLEV